jgi:GNAT superfamily N-acetyltransferase
VSGVVYSDDGSAVRPEELRGFFARWPAAPSPERHVELLRRSLVAIVARDEGRVVGFATAVGDGVLSAYIPLLEVLPEWQGRGIGSELVRRVLARLGGLYMVDLCCDAELEPFYRRLGFAVLDRGMGIRNRAALES